MTAQAKILVLNQYYWPGVEATAQLLAQLCEALAEDYDVTVVTGHLYGHELPAQETRNGVRIVRVRSTAYERSQIHLRAANYASYLGDTGASGVTFGLPPTVRALEAYLEMLEGSGLPWSVAVIGGDIVACGLARAALERSRLLGLEAARLNGLVGVHAQAADAEAKQHPLEQVAEPEPQRRHSRSSFVFSK